MTKTKTKKSKVKVALGKRVSHLGKTWTVLNREYDTWSSHSYYFLKNGKTVKWVRADHFSV